MKKKKSRTAKGHRSALRMLEAALGLFEEVGYEATTMRKISQRTGFSLGAVYRHFATKESLALALYERLAVDLEDWRASMPEGSVSERFQAAMKAKLALVEPHRPVLRALFANALNPKDPVGVLSERTGRIRVRVAGVFQAVVHGAKDAPKGDEASRLGRLLYGLHLALIFVWMQDQEPSRDITEQAVKLCSSLLAGLPMIQALPMLSQWLGKFDDLASRLLRLPEAEKPGELAQSILDCLIQRQRILPGEGVGPTQGLHHAHKVKLQASIDEGEPIQMVLPAFPAKAPNEKKVLGKDPDMAEWLALSSLRELCEEIRALYPPGVELIICSDGQVFADKVGVDDQQVKLYLEKLSEMLGQMKEQAITIFHIGDAFGEMEPDDARERLRAYYASPMEAIRQRAKDLPLFAAQVDGIHRFLLEDEVVRCPEESRNQIRKRMRPVAYEVVQLSEAWGRLISTCFPRAIRLSIHPQPLGAEKIGIRMLEAEDIWLTPWHSVAVLEGERYRLMKRADAEAIGATLVDKSDSFAHMEVP